MLGSLQLRSQGWLQRAISRIGSTRRLLIVLLVALLASSQGQDGGGGGYTSAPESQQALAVEGDGAWWREARARCGGCKKLLKRVKDADVEALLALADRQQGRGDLAAASKTMCAAVCVMTAGGASHRELPGALSNLGVLFKEQGSILAAEQCYRLALRLEPRNAGHHYRMANARLTRQELELARQSYMRATQRWPTFGDAYNNLGNCLMGMSRFQDAAAAYYYAVESNPGNANYLVNLGGVRARDDLSGAIDLLERALSIQPNFGEAWNNLANLYRDQGSLEKAAKAYEELKATREQKEKSEVAKKDKDLECVMLPPLCPSNPIDSWLWQG